MQFSRYIDYTTSDLSTDPAILVHARKTPSQVPPRMVVLLDDKTRLNEPMLGYKYPNIASGATAYGSASRASVKELKTAKQSGSIRITFGWYTAQN